MATNLPITIDADNADDATRPTVKTHQQHHDTIHAEVNRLSDGSPVVVSSTAPVDTSSLWIDTTGSAAESLTASPGAICFTWDDGYDSHATVAAMASSRGQKHTFAINSATIGTAGHLTWAQVSDIFAQGHEIASHGVTHVDMTGLTAAARAAQYDDSKSAIEAQIGAGTVSTWVYPFGARTATTDAELHLRYDRILGVGFAGGAGSPIIARPRDMQGGFLHGRIDWDGTAAGHQRVLDAIRLAAKSKVVVTIYSHDIDSGNSATTAQLTEALDLAQSLGVSCLDTKKGLPDNNLLRNAGFEDASLSAWPIILQGGTATVASVVDAPAAGFPGTRSLEIVHPTAQTTYVSQWVPIVPGRQQTLSFRYRVSGLAGAGTVYGRIRQVGYDGAVVSGTASTGALTSTTWVQAVANLTTVNASTTFVLVDLVLENVSGTVYFDHVHLGPTNEGVFG